MWCTVGLAYIPIVHSRSIQQYPGMAKGFPCSIISGPFHYQEKNKEEMNTKNERKAMPYKTVKRGSGGGGDVLYSRKYTNINTTHHGHDDPKAPSTATSKRRRFAGQ